MYTEASSQSPGDYAIMRSPDIVHLDSSTAKNLCFAFSYHMYGLHVGTLDLYFSKSATSMHKGDLVWSMSGEQGDRWIEKEIRVTDFISTSKSGYFIFEGRILTYTSDMAIDDISLGPCSAALKCEFDTDFCGWQQLTTDVFDWTRHNGPTSTLNTGPSNDHTYGTMAGYYIYTESSWPRSQNDYAVIRSPGVQLESTDIDRCFKFFYHMWGLNIGTLSLYFSTSGTITDQAVVVWSMSGPQTNAWIGREIRVTDFISTSTSGYFLFKGQIDSYTADMALDDISLGSCTGAFNCDFDTDFCGWQQLTTDVFDWTRHNGPTSTLNTGPSNDHTHGTMAGYYIYTESSWPRSQNDYAVIRSPGVPLESTDIDRCFKFFYHMWGLNIGTLSLYFSTSGTITDQAVVVWSMSGPQTNAWIGREIRVTDFISSSTSGYFLFKGQINSFTADMALDDISLGSCTVQLTTTTTQQTTTDIVTTTQSTTTYIPTTTQQTTTDSVTTTQSTTTDIPSTTQLTTTDTATTILPTTTDIPTTTQQTTTDIATTILPTTTDIPTTTQQTTTDIVTTILPTATDIPTTTQQTTTDTATTILPTTTDIPTTTQHTTTDIATTFLPTTTDIPTTTQQTTTDIATTILPTTTDIPTTTQQTTTDITTTILPTTTDIPTTTQQTTTQPTTTDISSSAPQTITDIVTITELTTTDISTPAQQTTTSSVTTTQSTTTDIPTTTQQTTTDIATTILPTTTDIPTTTQQTTTDTATTTQPMTTDISSSAPQTITDIVTITELTTTDISTPAQQTTTSSVTTTQSTTTDIPKTTQQTTTDSVTTTQSTTTDMPTSTSQTTTYTATTTRPTTTDISSSAPQTITDIVTITELTTTDISIPAQQTTTSSVTTTQSTTTDIPKTTQQTTTDIATTILPTTTDIPTTTQQTTTDTATTTQPMTTDISSSAPQTITDIVTITELTTTDISTPAQQTTTSSVTTTQSTTTDIPTTTQQTTTDSVTTTHTATTTQPMPTDISSSAPQTITDIVTIAELTTTDVTTSLQQTTDTATTTQQTTTGIPTSAPLSTTDSVTTIQQTTTMGTTAATTTNAPTTKTVVSTTDQADCSQSNTGSSFVIAFPSNLELGSESNSLVISTTSHQAVTVEVHESDGNTLSGVVTEGISLTFGLSENSRCTGSGLQDCSVRVLAIDGDISVIAYSEVGTSTGSFLAFPVDSLGEEYVIASYTPRGGFNSEFTVTAADTAATVIIEFPEVIRQHRLSNGLSPDLEFDLNAGQTYQVQSTLDLSASRVVSTAPVAVASGASCSELPIATKYCDYIVEQMPPVNTLGRSFSVSTYHGRPKSGLDVRIIATRDDTRITSGSRDFTIHSFWYLDLNENQQTAFDIEASEPVLVVQYQRGHESDSTGDQSMSVISPKEQFSVGSITFPVALLFAPSNFIMITVETMDESGIQFDDVLLDSSIATRTTTSQYTFWGKEISNDPHTVSHVDPDVPFSVVIYGYDKYEGYGTSAGTFLRPSRCRQATTTSPQVTTDASTTDISSTIGMFSNLVIITYTLLLQNLPDIKIYFVISDSISLVVVEETNNECYNQWLTTDASTTDIFSTTGTTDTTTDADMTSDVTLDGSSPGASTAAG
nr:uncharacterized protein LOC129255786 [Lytechinus pictus]